MKSSSSAHPNPETSNAPDHDPAGLGELEQTILRMVWQQRQVTADQIREQLDSAGRVLKESTVRTVLRRLEEKGYLAHTVEQRTYLYRAAEDGRSVAGRAVQRIVDRFCGGSVEALLVGMVNADVLSENELQRLAAKIARAKTKAGKSK
jgi:predicted transcriptional regulator